MQLDERTLRRPAFSEGPKVRLADGQEWAFPPPRFMAWPAVGPDGSIGVRSAMTYGPDHLDALDTLDGLVGDDHQATRIGLRLELATTLLLRNYDLDNRAIRRLISLDESTPEDLWPNLIAVLHGLDPSAAPDGVGNADAAPAKE